MHCRTCSVNFTSAPSYLMWKLLATNFNGTFIFVTIQVVQYNQRALIVYSTMDKVKLLSGAHTRNLGFLEGWENPHTGCCLNWLLPVCSFWSHFRTALGSAMYVTTNTLEKIAMNKNCDKCIFVAPAQSSADTLTHCLTWQSVHSTKPSS